MVDVSESSGLLFLGENKSESEPSGDDNSFATAYVATDTSSDGKSRTHSVALVEDLSTRSACNIEEGMLNGIMR